MKSDAEAFAELARVFSRSNPSISANAAEDLDATGPMLGVLLATPIAKVMVGELDGSTVAIMVVVKIPSLVHGGRNVLFIELLVVAEKYRRQGIGAAMVNYALEMASEAGAYKVLLVTRSDNSPARALYDKLGFEVNGIALALYL